MDDRFIVNHPCIYTLNYNEKSGTDNDRIIVFIGQITDFEIAHEIVTEKVKTIVNRCSPPPLIFP